MFDRTDPRTWPVELVDERNLALAYALGWRTDPPALAAFRAWPRHRPKPQRVVSPQLNAYTAGGIGG